MDTYPQIMTLFLVAGNVTEEISAGKLLLTLFLVFLNGFFVAAEFAIVKVRSSQIQANQDINAKVAEVAKSIVDNLDAYLAATQLGITLASLGLGWVGESSLTPVIMGAFGLFGLEGEQWAEIARSVSFPIAFLIITILHIVFGELAPKSIAIHFPAKTTFALAWPLKIFYFIFRPVIWLMNGLANAILRMIGIKPIHGSDIHSEEELKMIITQSQEGGAIEETERLLIQNVFDFDDRRVLNIQTLRKNVSAIEIKTSVKEAIDYAINEGYSRYPVYEDSLDNIKGIVYTKDLIKKLLSTPEDTSIESLLRQPIFISEGALIKNVLKQFQKKHVQMAVVTNEVGEFSGIISMEDILEELVGEIQDEYDNEEPIVTRVSEGVYNVNAHYNLSDINRMLPYKFEEGEHYDTLAGLIAQVYYDTELKENDSIDLDCYSGTILKMYRNSVEKVQLSLHLDLENTDVVEPEDEH
ncbi:hemolysin family protein [Flavobacterium sp. HSC-61S13]|uniref:hemolysin family protein n=1 Tax=Flavobacterium sp. HSC-61S13 TaxID=2910963 RepID=UPI0020A1BCB1|nr:hemolysin family protein [Flavobacterium sp. HSC-61S13]MCP1997211.1 CBS domain containing-hemolysin-like protein [Flavobacterium sp. HSC-61S13]